MASPSITLSTGTKSSYNKTAYRPPSSVHTNTSNNANYCCDNTFMCNKRNTSDNVKHTQNYPENYPELGNKDTNVNEMTGHTTTKRRKIPNATGPKTSLTSKEYSNVTKDIQKMSNEHNKPIKPNSYVIHKKRMNKANKNNTDTYLNLKDLWRSKERAYNIQQDNKYFDEREKDIVDEMRFSLSQDEFEDWYSHHLEVNKLSSSENENNNDDYCYDEYTYEGYY